MNDDELGPDGWPTCVVCGRSCELQLPDGRWLCDEHYREAKREERWQRYVAGASVSEQEGRR